MANMCFYKARIARFIIAPDALDNHIGCQNLPGMSNQQVEQAALGWCEPDFSAIPGHFVSHGIESDRPYSSCRRSRSATGAGGASHNSFNAGKQLARAEWFAQVIISTQLQATHFVIFTIMGCKNQHHRVRLTSHLATYFKTVEFGHLNVQDHEIG